ncbi:MAG: biotin--[acetyl-CoA-carboxylase] ligase [Lautropia sp.]|nr:biotin--[acetyl-CoA-carboxylase] ligase [Lautropia sp.]
MNNVLLPDSDDPRTFHELARGHREGRLWVKWQAVLDSTNLELMRRPSLLDCPERGEENVSGCSPSAIWLIAGEQTAGKGRRGKVWKAAPGSALTASLGRELPPGSLIHMAAVPLVAGVVLAEYLAHLGVKVMVKWPNDLCRIQDDASQELAKVGGILCEVRSRGPAGRLVIGCGLNLQGLPQGLVTDQPVGALFDTLTEAQRVRIALGVGRALLAGTDQLLEEGFSAFSARWQAVDALAGRAVRVHGAQGVRDAMALGIDHDGRLRVRYEEGSGEVALLSAEQVSIRPRQR